MKQVVAYVTAHHGYSERRACSLTRLNLSTLRKRSIRDSRTEIHQRMREIVQTRIRYGYRRVHVSLRREGWVVGKNNGSLRDECLNIHWFHTLSEARCLIEAWRIEYKESRPHMALGNIPPSEYASRAVSSTA
jgi:transposase InsO family protein